MLSIFARFSRFLENEFTMKNTTLAVTKYRNIRVHVGTYGSFSLVTGLVRNVFAEVSNSGRFSSSSSIFCKSHSQIMIDCLRFHNSKNVVAEIEMRKEQKRNEKCENTKRTDILTSKRYANAFLYEWINAQAFVGVAWSGHRTTRKHNVF